MRVCACMYSCMHEDVKVGTCACANLCAHTHVCIHTCVHVLDGEPVGVQECV